MAALQITFTWVAYAIVVALFMLFTAIFVFTYQDPRERSPAVTIVAIITLTSLLATVLLLPVDIALIASTSSPKLGRKKDWATPERVDSILLTLKIVYYTLYSFDAILCLIVAPFTYFWHEEYDDIAEDDGGQSVAGRFWTALRFTLVFIVLVVILFIVGFFVPIARDRKGKHWDLDYFKHLLTENPDGERALTFALGLLITLGTALYVFYTASGIALLPISFIKSAPSISAPSLIANTASHLEANRERQRQLEGRNAGRSGLSAKDQRELEALIREERTLVRRQRLAAEASGEGRSWVIRAWTKTQAIFRPIKLLGGILLLILVVIIWASMLITGIDKAKNSICKHHCGYLLTRISVFNPINWIFVKSAEVFPVDYVMITLIVLIFFSSSIVGITTVGIRFLWVRIFQIRNGHTSPQALLIATVMLTLIVLAINYSLAMIVAPQYATFGSQTFCKIPPKHPGEQPDCSDDPELVLPCSELADSAVCTPSVVSTFLNRIMINFPFFGVVCFWAQFVFLGVSLLVLATALFRAPRLDEAQLDEDAEAAEEEGLLASAGRRFGATWEDIRGKTRAGQTTTGNAGGHSTAPRAGRAID
ncbi:hypothetical protein FGG08_004338 [Glutinoglossum americanum]|uniref:Probable lysosomal cobalamin transporter n=1 Tax=Glutinoglossum americanum TaxID=1670608 RepID=A0A9P8KX68_9PEZI|nr:hypothetical protein FGG08_004338 [Glutinoglossum americanum]